MQGRAEGEAFERVARVEHVDGGIELGGVGVSLHEQSSQGDGVLEGAHDGAFIKDRDVAD